jgi:lipoate-protein ligase A
MACDEALLECADASVLRAYRWSAPAVTFGYSQRLAAVLALAGSRPVMRRWTGGGTVFHGEDLTLALVVPADEALASRNSVEMYRAIHDALLPAIQTLYPKARMVTPEECRCGAVCFESPVAHDVVEGSRKIFGGAMRRSRRGILYQGSLHAPGLDPAALASALGEAAGNFQGTGAVAGTAGVLERERYGTDAWRNLR